jgi:hypothetical protein
MPTILKTKNSVTTTVVPTTLQQGELAVNITDKKVWVGNAATTPVQLLGDGGSASFTSIAFGAGTVSAPSITFTGDTNTGIYSPAADTIAFTEGGVESVRITSAGDVGIGTSSPARKLDVAGDSQFGTSSTNGVTARFFNSSSQLFIGVDNSAGSNTGVANGQYLLGIGAFPLTFYTNSSERMRITSAGDVGIGVAAPDIFGRFYTRTLGISSSGTTGLQINSANGNNCFFDMGINAVRYFGIQIDQSNGNPFVGSLTSVPLLLGSNGAERMRITSAGRVGIGTGSPYETLDVRSVNSTFSSDDTDTNVFITSGFDVALRYVTRLRTDYFGVFSIATGSGSNAVAPSANTPTERLRINSNGGVMISTTAAIWNSSERLAVQSANSNAPAISAYVTAGASTYVYTSWNNATSGTRQHIAFADGTSGSTRGTITTDGANTAYNTSSDYRLKDNVAPITGALAKVQQLKPSSWVWKTNGEMGEGFVAHELAQVIPHAVTGEKDEVDAEGKPVYQGLDASFLVATLTAAIQEQQALIENLTTRLNALEGK